MGEGEKLAGWNKRKFRVGNCFFYPDFEKRYDIVGGGSEFRRWLRFQSVVLLELVE